MCRTFKLKKACIDCPFKKGNSYLNPESLKMKIDAVTKQDQSFSCHKTVDYDAYNDYQEVSDEIEILADLASEGYSKDALEKERQKLEDEFNFKEIRDQYNKTQANEMYCAGMLILVKKEGMLFNNFPLRYAVGSGLLDINQFKDEDQVYDSIADAIFAHSQSI